MKYYDQHLHTHFSPDSREEFENYLSQSDLPIVTTEHLDYFGPRINMKDSILDYEEYVKTINELNERYDNRVLKGIEVGFTRNDLHNSKAYLADKDFDIMLLSVHHNGLHGFMTLNHGTRDLQEHLDEYFTLLLEAVEHFPEANVLAHFDFGLRGYDDVTIADIEPIKDKLVEIFKKMQDNEQALELNTRSMYQYGNAHLYEHVIELYQSVGGKLFTVSSDAHRAEDYRFNFDKAFAMLEKAGVEELAIFQKQKLHLAPLPKNI